METFSFKCSKIVKNASYLKIKVLYELRHPFSSMPTAPSSGCQTYIPVYRVKKMRSGPSIETSLEEMQCTVNVALLFIFHRSQRIILSINNGSFLQFHQK